MQILRIYFKMILHSPQYLPVCDCFQSKNFTVQLAINKISYNLKKKKKTESKLTQAFIFEKQKFRL